MSMKKPQLGMSARKTVGNTVYHIFMVALSVIMIYPFIWSLLSSFKSSEQLYGGNPLDLWPRPFTMENYKRLFQVLPFDKFTVNSVFLSVAMPLCMIAVASLTAYALTRLEFRGRNILFLAFIATMMIPSHVTLIPNYKIVVDMKLINTYAALFLTNMFTGANAFNIFSSASFSSVFPRTWKTPPSSTAVRGWACFSASCCQMRSRPLPRRPSCRSAVCGTRSCGRCW